MWPRRPDLGFSTRSLAACMKFLITGAPASAENPAPRMNTFLRNNMENPPSSLRQTGKASK